MARINISKNPDQLIQLAQSIVAKHTADGAGSLLAGLDMADLSAKTTTADTQNKAATKLYRDAETATQNRDLALGKDGVIKGTVGYYVRSARDVLQGIYKGNEQKLGDWGFEVVAGPRVTAEKPAPAKAAA